MKVEQVVKIESHPDGAVVAICTPDDAANYINAPVDEVYKIDSLEAATELARIILMDSDIHVIMDDINKFPCARSCHMERGAIMKAFFLPLTRLRNKSLILRTDEISDSLNVMIEKLFSDQAK